MHFLRSIFAFLLLPWLCSSDKRCPTKCSCFLDEKGRKVVSCAQGGMTDIPFLRMEASTEVIIVSAPENDLNTLIMSPAIQDFSNLEELHITRSNIPELGVHLFWTLRKLAVLNLSQNNITQPLDESFRGLIGLRELYLDDNRINSLHSGTFRYLSSLKILSLQRNRIKQMTIRMFENLGKLQVLKLSGNYLRELNPESFKDVLQDLRVLECRGCSLQKINTHVYGYLPHLAHLDLGYNELDNLSPDDFVNLTSLVFLGLDGNRISVLQNQQFDHASNLKRINLSKNRIRRIEPEAFLNLPKLEELDMAYNKLEEVDGELLKPIANSLQKLTLSGNRLSTKMLKEFLSGAPFLRDLQLVDAGIVSLPGGVFPPRLSVLNLSGNYIAFVLPESVPATLLDLDLSKNRFQGLSEGFLDHVEFVTNLNLEGNPWSCDLCHIVPMLERTNRSSFLSSVKCEYPYILEGRPLGSLTFQELNWCPPPGYSDGANFFFAGEDERIGIIAASASLILLILTGCAVIGAFCYSRRHAARYYTHEEKRTPETESIFDGALFGDERELSFKFPVEAEKKIAIATIDEEFKKEPLANGV